MRDPLYTSVRYVKTIALCLTLGACGAVATEAPVKTVFVDRAVPVSCLPADFPQPPIYTDTKAELKAAADFAARNQLMDANWALRDTRLSLDEAAIDACRKAAPAK